DRCRVLSLQSRSGKKLAELTKKMGNSMNMSMGTKPRYKTDLNWLQRLNEFSPAERKVLLKTALFKARMRKAGTQVLLRWSREWELPLSQKAICAGEADSRGDPIPFPRSGVVGAGPWGRRGKTAWPCTSGPGMPGKFDQRDRSQRVQSAS